MNCPLKSLKFRDNDVCLVNTRVYLMDSLMIFKDYLPSGFKGFKIHSSLTVYKQHLAIEDSVPDFVDKNGNGEVNCWVNPVCHLLPL